MSLEIKIKDILPVVFVPYSFLKSISDGRFDWKSEAKNKYKSEVNNKRI